MTKPGQIQSLMDAATQSLAGVMLGSMVEVRRARVDAALARYGIFTEATVTKCTVGAGNSPETADTQMVYVVVDVRFTAPDGSFATMRTVGEGCGDFTNASTDAAEQAQWTAISDAFRVDPGDDAALG